MNFSSWTSGGGYLESLSKNAKALAATAAERGSGYMQNMVQRPENELSEEDENAEPDLSKMSEFDREVYQRRRDFERSQNLHQQNTHQPKKSKLKLNSFSTMEGTEEEYENMNEEQLDQNILSFVGDSSDENEKIVKKSAGGQRKSAGKKKE